MGQEYNLALMIAAALSAMAGALHIGVVLVGPRWYRLFGAGEKLARAAEAGRVYPALITFGIAFVLFAWAAYALSGAGVLGPLPLLRPALVAISLVYLLRGAAGPLILKDTGRSLRFIYVSSAICLAFALVHLLGLVQVWSRLG
ncbi:hypothetical protein N7414_14545 [Pseudomonas sp. GD04087]|uniref:hypothetical protein n=1 Tax=unclassified Pseudomonas TaxID=196821 RepID=UPI002448E208|nr:MULTISPECIES: hypothetical protein [unclassified Pseudomonas]MDH0290339.1 hypothetical protein [Pseudomonas sp. GD04087]MDH1047460.1 hypothetical protein [Pseudomonas sp. GD03903]MDH2000233.1 hypothetical protein [Pseudomonas sp. GD03691]